MIRWSSSVLTAIILHAVCWFWADQILPPDISESQRSQRLAITIATNQITSSKLAPVNQENLAPPSILPVLPSPQIMKREHVTQPESNESPEPQKKQITAKPVIAKITKSTLKQIQIRPKRKALPPVRNKVETPLPKVKTKTPSIAVLDSQPGQKTLPSPVQAVKTSPSSSPKEVLPIKVSLSVGETTPVQKTSSHPQSVTSVPSQVAPTFKNLPLVTQPAFSKPPNPPQYPKRAKRKRLQGQVILRARVDKQGLVEHIVIWQSSGHKLLDKAAEKAMWDWQFTPAKQAGIRTASWVEFPVNFAIR